jgi:hypothetical protein
LSPDVDPAFGVLGRDGGHVTVPMKLEAAITWNVIGASPADCPDLIDPSTGSLFTAVGVGEGRGTHLGRFEITKFDHPTINLCSFIGAPPAPPTPADLTRDGSWEFVAADGSTLYGSYSFFFTGGAPGGYFDLAVEGGTKRLAGAQGSLTFLEEESGSAVAEDPLFLTTTILEPAVFDGTLTLPRPGNGS